MDASQQLILLILACTVGLFLWGRRRHDVVALAALMACVVSGLTPTTEAFVGFGHPAVITVAAVLILSKGLQTTGAVEALAQRALPQRGGMLLGLGVLTLLGATLSAFMNNVGAMALLMPIALQLASRNNIPPGKVLMPLAFGTILGGMTTLIGTPPNLIVSGFRAQTELGAYGMFDFTPVGLAVAIGGVLLAVIAGRWLVPNRPQTDASNFDTGTYLTEVHIDADSKADGKQLREVEQMLDDGDAQIVGMVRNDFRVIAPQPGRRLHAGDILVIEADPDALGTSLTRLGLKLEEAVEPDKGSKDEADESESDSAAEVAAPSEQEQEKPAARHSDDIALQELVAQPGAAILGRSASDIALRTRFGINLLAISRQGHRSIRRLRWTEIEAGDVLLMQGDAESIAGFAAEYGCVPLAQRSILIPDRRRAITAVAIMIAAVALAAFGVLPAAVAFTAGVLGYMLTRVIPLRRIYEAIDWPIIILLGALMPLAAAMAETGAADVLARTLLEHVAQGNPVIALTLMLVVTMTLSDFMNNAATAAVMCPIALSIASQLGVNPDSFLMAVAIGASCAFLTPIGHQNNTLILGPGGFRFGDYWRLGLPMELLVVAIGIPMLLWVWPL
ncbi:SLC13 family permease [Halopseudomonas aestusnigri]|uniref:TrkA-C domain-containing protein n=1 Tax=Halopseudomonas aestusnigri TaxID=857252 RepID=A0AAQ1G7E0_9GAMM|nr:SLC13 family permease [Halopseudomonas aestusnigri]OWL89662.1 SLC13 family permease [Halopseudomonas aestusnigri]SEG25459.1 TrkA-C domain-containing protein [Halopseudomonas aestusnigri]